MTTQEQIQPRAVGVEAAYRALGIGRTAFYQLVQRGEIRIIKLGGRTLVPCSEIDRLVNDQLRAAK